MTDPREQRLEFISVAETTEKRLRFVSLSFEKLTPRRGRARVALERKPGRTAIGTSEGTDSERGDFDRPRTQPSTPSREPWTRDPVRGPPACDARPR